MKTCTKCNIDKEETEFYYKDSTKIKRRSRCKSCLNSENYNKIPKQEYYLKNREIILNRVKSYSKKPEAKQKERIRRRKEYKLKSLSNTNYKLSKLLRHRIFIALKNNSKSNNTLKLLDCSLEKLKEYLQQTAILNGYKDFDINNYSGQEYHIDHIIPCASFDLSKEEEQKKCFNYTNLQILKAEKNLSKGDKIWE